MKEQTQSQKTSQLDLAIKPLPVRVSDTAPSDAPVPKARVVVTTCI